MYIQYIHTSSKCIYTYTYLRTSAECVCVVCVLCVLCVCQVVEILLAKGANFEHRNVSDYTPLSLAASGGYVNIIKMLLRAGADINSRLEGGERGRRGDGRGGGGGGLWEVMGGELMGGGGDGRIMGGEGMGGDGRGGDGGGGGDGRIMGGEGRVWEVMGGEVMGGGGDGKIMGWEVMGGEGRR